MSKNKKNGKDSTRKKSAENNLSRREFLASAAGAAVLTANLNFSIAAKNKNMTETKNEIDFLEKYPTSLLESAIYLLSGTHDNITFTKPGLARRTAAVKRLVGYAVTCEFSTDPDDERGRKENIDYWTYIFKQHQPKIAVAVDTSKMLGSGSSWGQQNAHIHKGLGCRGVLTNGGVRDIKVFDEIGFTVFSGSLTVGHGNPHFVKFGEPVTLYGAVIKSGDVIVADEQGSIVIPQNYLPDIEEAAAEINRRVKIVADYCQQPGLTPAGLLEATRLTKPATPWKPGKK